MALDTVDKMRITKYLKTTPYDELCWGGFYGNVKRDKYTDYDVLVFLLDSTLKKLNSLEKVSDKILCKYICYIDNFFWWANEKKLPSIKEEAKIRVLKEKYLEYCEKTGQEVSSNIIEMIDGITEEIDREIYSKELKGETLTEDEKEEVRDSFDVSQYVDSIMALEEKVKQLELSLEQKLREYDALQKTSLQKEKKYNKQTEETGILKQQISNKEQEVTKLQKEIKELKDKIEDLSNRAEVSKEEYSNLQSEYNKIIERFETLTETYNALLQSYADLEKEYEESKKSLTSEVERLQGIIDVNDEIKVKLEQFEERQEKIKSLIYQRLLIGETNIDGILLYLRNYGLISNKEEVYNALKQVKSIINIESNSFSISPTYNVILPTINENGVFNINVPEGCKSYDIMLVSDFHLRTIGNKEVNSFSMLNEYCASNGIKLILNMGDFFDGIGTHMHDFNAATANYKLVENAVSLIPRNDDLYHALLGGNHDKKILQYGFDPIERLTSEREDFINLGYTHATIALHGSKSLLGSFDIHHPQTFDFAIDIDPVNGIDLEGMNNYFNRVYQGRSRNDSYVDIFGHTHKSQVNNPFSYAYVPSFCNGNGRRGACHLRIYFDPDTSIKYMVFMPLSITNRLTKSNEIVYQKTLIK